MISVFLNLLRYVWASLVAQLVKNPPAMQKTLVRFLSREDPLEDRLPTPVFLGFPCGSVADVGELGLIPGLGRSPGEGNSYPLRYSDLQNSLDCIVLSMCWWMFDVNLRRICVLLLLGEVASNINYIQLTDGAFEFNCVLLPAEYVHFW